MFPQKPGLSHLFLGVCEREDGLRTGTQFGKVWHARAEGEQDDGSGSVMGFENEKGRFTRPFDRHPSMASGSQCLDFGGQAALVASCFVFVEDAFVGHRVNDLLSHFEQISSLGFIAGYNSFLNVLNYRTEAGAQRNVGIIDLGGLANALQARSDTDGFFLGGSRACD